MAEAVFRHEIEYPDNHGITLSEIAATLIAQEKLIPIALEALEKIYPGLSIEKVSIRFDYAQSGSLKEALYVAVLTTYQKDLERAVPALIEHLIGVRVPDEYKSLVSVLSILFLYFAAKTISDKITKGRADESTSAPTIKGDYNTYINIAAGKLDVPPRVIEDAVNATATSKRRGTLTRAAIDMFRPAKKGGPGRIVVPGLPDVSREAVAEFPDSAALADLEEGTEVDSFPDATLEIRATDRDKADRGWYGKLHAGPMSTSRLSLRLSPLVDREALAKRDTVKVGALVESRRLDDDTLKAIRIHVLNVFD